MTRLDDWYIPESYGGSFVREAISAERMLEELEAGSLEVVLIPPSYSNHSGHKLRAVQSTNAQWYSEFCRRHQSIRGKMKRPRTYIKRENTVRALKLIIEGETEGVYVKRLLDFMRSYFGKVILKEETDGGISS